MIAFLTDLLEVAAVAFVCGTAFMLGIVATVFVLSFLAA